MTNTSRAKGNSNHIKKRRFIISFECITNSHVLFRNSCITEDDVMVCWEVIFCRLYEENLNPGVHYI